MRRKKIETYIELNKEKRTKKITKNDLNENIFIQDETINSVSSSMEVHSELNMVKKPSPTLSISEVEDLLAYQLSCFDKKNYLTTYQAVNFCIKIIKSDYNDYIKNICINYLFYVFKSLLLKTISANERKIVNYLNKSLYGSYIDFEDIYQSLYIYFYELITHYDINSGVYFVTYLRRYLFYWGKNNYSIRKLDLDIEVNYLSDMNNYYKSSGSDNYKEDYLQRNVIVSLKDSTDKVNYKSGTVDLSIYEDTIIDNIVILDFRRYLERYLDSKYVSGKKNKKVKTNKKNVLDIYDYFFIYKQKNYSRLAKELGCNAQRIQYYIDIINRLFLEYLSN